VAIGRSGRAVVGAVGGLALARPTLTLKSKASMMSLTPCSPFPALITELLGRQILRSSLGVA
jgi:hypothetical protein